MDPTERIPQPKTTVIAHALGEEMVLLNTQTESYFTLNAVGAQVWRLLDGERSVAAIVEELCRHYGLPASQIRPDVDALLADLEQHALVTWRTEGV